jgi:hypothetical protein
MAKAKITVKVTTSADLYWVAVDDTDLSFQGGKATIDLEPGRYWLAWWFIGAPGSPYKIELFKPGNTDPFLKIDLNIAKDATKSAGVRRFRV